MLSKIALACAIIAGAQATEIKTEATNRGYNGLYDVQGAQGLQFGHGSHGFPWVRRSTYRPRDIKAYNVEPVDNYWKEAPKVKETIIATCEFDFLGYSHSEGRVTLKQEVGDLTSIIGGLEGLNPGLHGFKIHEFGDLEYGCESTGAVFNPFGASQGESHQDMKDRRVGDIEQIQARWNTKAEFKNRDAMVELSGPNSVIGRSMVVYEREDDHHQTEHEATHEREGRYREGKGERIACCVIGLAKGEKPKPKPQPKAYRPPQHFGHGYGDY